MHCMDGPKQSFGIMDLRMIELGISMAMFYPTSLWWRFFFFLILAKGAEARECFHTQAERKAHKWEGSPDKWEEVADP